MTKQTNTSNNDETIFFPLDTDNIKEIEEFRQKIISVQNRGFKQGYTKALDDVENMIDEFKQEWINSSAVNGQAAISALEYLKQEIAKLEIK